MSQIKKIKDGTLTWQSVPRRIASAVLIILGALVTMKGLNPETTWMALLTLFTPLVTFGLGIQIIGGILSSIDTQKP